MIPKPDPTDPLKIRRAAMAACLIFGGAVFPIFTEAMICFAGLDEKTGIEMVGAVGAFLVTPVVGYLVAAQKKQNADTENNSPSGPAKPGA